MNKDKVFDELLVMKCQEGDQKAFELIIKRWNKKLISFAYKFTHDVDVAKDVVQESWISIHKGISRLKEPDKLSSWLFRITYNKTMDHVRKSSRHDALELPSPQEEEDINTDERWSTIEVLLKNLPTSHKTILTLFYMEEHSIKEIAEILQVSQGTVKSRIFYAREKLKKKYKEVKNET